MQLNDFALLCSMPLNLAALNSGSNGNCYYVGNDTDAVLIDAGISCRETERRMKRLGLDADKVRAIFISHEHTDHTRGVDVLSRKHRIPVYITPATHRAGRLRLSPLLVKTMYSSQTVQIGDLTVLPFFKQHDGVDPHSFTVRHEGLTVGVFTDIGHACDKMIHHFGKCHAAFLETNYDYKMLMEGRYPYYLKQRIHGERGHLSNDQALELFMTHRSTSLELLVLSHLSAHNNHPQIVRDLFMPHANGTRIEIASRYEETELFCIPLPRSLPSQQEGVRQ
jgi:phosphoribosyl 1,2-cyclic phosphodiesterase